VAGYQPDRIELSRRIMPTTHASPFVDATHWGPVSPPTTDNSGESTTSDHGASNLECRVSNNLHCAVTFGMHLKISNAGQDVSDDADRTSYVTENSGTRGDRPIEISFRAEDKVGSVVGLESTRVNELRFLLVDYATWEGSCSVSRARSDVSDAEHPRGFRVSGVSRSKEAHG
jgi:hypothetical protein